MEDQTQKQTPNTKQYFDIKGPANPDPTSRPVINSSLAQNDPMVSVNNPIPAVAMSITMPIQEHANLKNLTPQVIQNQEFNKPVSNISTQPISNTQNTETVINQTLNEETPINKVGFFKTNLILKILILLILIAAVALAGILIYKNKIGQ